LRRGHRCGIDLKIEARGESDSAHHAQLVLCKSHARVADGAHDPFFEVGPAVNEVARIEALCEPLGRAVLVSAEFVGAALDGDSRLESLGRHALRGVREPKEIFALAASAGP